MQNHTNFEKDCSPEESPNNGQADVDTDILRMDDEGPVAEPPPVRDTGRQA